MSATNAGRTLPHEAGYGTMLEMKILAFFQPGCMRMNREQKSQPQACGMLLYRYLNGGNNISSD